MSLMGAFWQEESTPALRRLLLDEAAGRSEGAAEFNFNMFDVVLNFETGTATVSDALTRDGTSQTTDLNGFHERATSFNDDPSIGDGRTSIERTQPEFEIDGDGTAARLRAVEPALSQDETITAQSAWFNSYMEQRNVFAPPEGGPYTCPCCGHNALGERGVYEICRTCGWEDDGQDDHDSGIVRGGPNGQLSLDDARMR